MSLSLKHSLTLFLLVVFFLFSACSHVISPRGPIPVKMDIVGPIDSSNEIGLAHGLTESKLTLIGTYGAHKYFADFKQWTDFIVDQLEGELKKRGVQVKSDGEDVFKVSVENVRLFWGAWAIRCIVNVRLEKSDGTWSKAFEGNNASPATLYRAVDGAVYRVVEAMIGDRGFRKAISR